MRSKRIVSQVSTHSAGNSRKRKRKANYIVFSSDEEEEEEEEEEDKDSSGSETLDEDEYYIKCILDETESQYLIDWEGSWTPTWEPKENANEAAKQVWEEKKKGRLSPQISDLIETEPTQSHISLSTEQSTQSCAQPPRLRELNSPLFVPPHNTISNLTYLQGNNETSQLSPTPNRTSSIQSNNTSVLVNREPSSSTDPPYGICLFQTCRTLPIPLEYRLPGEIEGPIASITQGTASAVKESCTERANLDLDGVTFGDNSTFQTLKQTLNIRRDTLKEIPETPPVSLNLNESQASYKYPGQRIFGLQESANPFTLLPTTSNSRHSLSSIITLAESPVASHPLSIPESDVVHISHISPSQNSRRLPAMEDPNQPKEGLSLSETLEKYSHIEGSTPREKIRNSYAKLREKVPTDILQTEPSATPSSIGDIEPSAPISVPETVAPLSVRVDKEPSHAIGPEIEPVPEHTLESVEPQQYDIQTIQPSALTVSHIEQASPGSVILGPSEFAVPLPMDSRVKDDYERMLLNETESIWGLSSNSKSQVASDHETMPKMLEILHHLSNVTTHPDLNIAQHIKDTDSDLRKEAAWAEYSSAKFLLLSYLIEALSDHDIHLVITVHGEKTRKVVERYLCGKGLAHTRLREEMGSGTNMEVSMAKGPLSFGIQTTTQNDGVMETYKPPTAILALDSSLNIKTPSMEHMRTTYARNGNLLPVIWLMVANSSEHIERCFSGYSTPQRLLSVLRHSVRLRDMVGDLQDDALGVQEDAHEIASCLLSDNFNAYWTLPRIEPLHDISASESTKDDGHSGHSTENKEPTIAVAPKRVFVEDTIETVSKRPRMDTSQDTSQFTDITKVPTQTLDSDLHALEKNLVYMKNSHAAALEKLQKALAATQSRLQEREQLLGSLQHRYETRTADLHKIRKERDGLLEVKGTLEERQDKQRNEITKLKDERTQLRRELEQAREALKSGGKDMAELEAAREEIRRLTKENASLERKSEYEHRQAEYTREQYQTASSVAAQTGNEVRGLREENEKLKQKLAGEAVRLRELNLKNDEARHLARVTELEAILASREDILRRKEDELREIRRNRPSTRSTSTQPRSPKLTAGNSRPTSPGFNNGSNFPGRGSGLRFSSEMSL